MGTTLTWQKSKLAEIVDYKTGKLNSNAAVENGNYPFFTCSKETFRTNTWSFDCECVLLAGNNANAEYPVKYFKGKFDAYQRTYVITSKNTKQLNIRYLYYCIELKLNLLKSLSTGSATRFLTKGILDNLDFELPPKDDQDVIVGILSSYDNLIENNRRRITILEDMAQSLYREWFVKFRFPGYQDCTFIDSSLGKIPEGWEVKRIQDFGEVVTGKTPSTTKNEYYSSNDVPFLKTPDMHGSVFATEITDYISFSGADSQKKKYIPKNSICVSCIGAKAGVVAITPCVVQTNQQINSVVLFEDYYREYLYLFASTLHEKIHALGSSGATMTNVSKGKFETIEIIFPEITILKQFHMLMSPVMDQILNLQKRNHILKKQRDMLLPKLISGSIKTVEPL